MEIRQSAGKNFAYLLGVYLGDGAITASSPSSTGKRYPVFRLNTIDKDFAEAVRQAIIEIYDCPVSISKHDVKKSSKPNYSLNCCNRELCRTLARDTGAKEVIPDYIWTSPTINKKSFIIGLMDSEGFVAANKSNPTNRRYYMGYKSCDIWVPEFIRLLQSVGLKIGKVSQEKPRKPHYKIPTRFHIKMQSWVDAGMRFNIQRKQSRVDDWASAGPYENRALNPRRLTPETNMSDTAR